MSARTASARPATEYPMPKEDYSSEKRLADHFAQAMSALFVLNLARICSADSSPSEVSMLSRVLNWAQYVPLLYLYGASLWVILGHRAALLTRRDLGLLFYFLIATYLSPMNAFVFSQRFVWNESLRDTFSYLGVLLVFLGAAKSSWPALLASLSKRWPVYIAILLIYIMKTFPVDMGFWRQTESVHYLAMDITLCLVFLIPAILPRSFAERLVGFACYVVAVIYVIYIQSRSGIVVLGVVAPVTFLSATIRPRGADTGHLLRRRASATIVALVLFASIGLAFLGAAPAIGWLEERWSGVAARIAQEQRSAQLTGDDVFRWLRREVEVRGGEIPSVLSQATPKTWLVGEGFGGMWFSEYWHTWWSYVHNGQVYLLMKGGVLYALVFMILVVRAIRRGFQNPTAPYNLSCLALVVSKIVAYSVHADLYLGISTALFWLSIGYLLSQFKSSRKDADLGKNERSMAHTRLRRIYSYRTGV